MIECGSLEYALTRLQCRHGQRADEATWHRLETARELASLLDAVRQSSLRPWVRGITAQATAHVIERTLRSHWRSWLAEVGGWMPPAWHPALAWCAVLPQLQPLQHLARGGAVRPWMHDDPPLQALCAVTQAERTAVLAAGPLAPLAAAWSAPSTLARAWNAEWRRRLPQRGGAGAASVDALVAVLVRHAEAFAAAPPGPGAQLRQSLQSRLLLLLRRWPLEPGCAFVHVVLCALDLERLRGELLGRALFPHLQVA